MGLVFEVLIKCILLLTERGLVEMPAEINRTPKAQIPDDEQVLCYIIGIFNKNL